MTCTTVTRLRLRSLSASLLLAALACGGDDPTGSVSVSYSIGASNNCATLDVQRIHVDIGEGEKSTEADCDPSQPIIIDGINAGNYPLLVTAIDSMGITVMDNLDAPEDDDNVEVVGGSSREVDVALAATPATIGLKWLLTLDGEAGLDCQTILATKALQVVAYENSGTSVLLTHDFDCKKEVPGFAQVDDPDRDINGQNLDAVKVRLLDDSNAELTSETFEFASPGPGRAVEITITCDESSATHAVTCTGETNIGGGSGTTDATGEDPTGGLDSSSGG